MIFKKGRSQRNRNKVCLGTRNAAVLRVRQVWGVFSSARVLGVPEGEGGLEMMTMTNK